MTCRYQSLRSLAQSIDSDPTRIVDIASETLNGLETIGHALDAVVHIAADEAMARAERLSQQARHSGAPVTPLFGVPLAHKDLYMRNGWPCTGGSKSLKGHIASSTALAVDKLDQAGAIDCARLDSVEFGLGTTGHNDYCGTPRNPWNRDYICGGSSSGSAAVVAAGLVPGALGTDTGGSIRLPAAACGLVGLKPTHGLVGRSGVFTLSPTLDTVGPLTRSVEDAGIMLNAIMGADDHDSASVNMAPRDCLAQLDEGIDGIRIGWPENHFLDDIDGALSDGLSDVFQRCGRLGANLSDVHVPGIEAANAMTMQLIAVEGLALHERDVTQHHALLGGQTLSRLLVGAFIPARDYYLALARRAQTARRVIDETFSRVDVLMTPMWPYPLPTIEASDAGSRPQAAGMVLRSGHNTRPVNYLGFPSITVPTGFDANGLPTSLQLMAPPYAEPMLLRVARAIERELDFWSGRPDLSIFTTSAAHSPAA